MSSNRLKIVLIGFGRMGKNHYRVMADSPRVSVVAVVDPKLTKGDTVLPANVKILNEISELEGLDFDGIVIATPTQHHFETAKKAIAFKRPILIEKPICSTHQEGLELNRICEKAKIPLFVGHVERHNPAIKKLKEVVTSGILGTPIHCSVTRVGGYPDNVEKGNNVLLDLAVHDIDVLQMIFGKFEYQSSVAHCTVKPDIFDTAQINGICNGVVSADIHANWITPTKIRTISLTGSYGVCLVDYMLQTCNLLGCNLLKQGPGHYFTYEDLVELYRSSDKIELGVVRQEPLRAQLEQYVNAIEGKPHSLCVAADAARVVQLAEQSLESAIKIVKSFPVSPPNPHLSLVEAV